MSKQVNQVKLGAEFMSHSANRISNDKCLWGARMRRDKVAESIPEWEEMRQLASDTKVHILAHMHQYLLKFTQQLRNLGVHVHYAKDAEEHNRIICEIFKEHGVKVVTKGKSMTMDECGMREYLEERGFEINEADLGERIQQLDNQRDSHIVMPAIHKLRQDVAKIFARELGSDPERTEPEYLNSVMRRDMRPRYVRSDAGMSGVNYALADSGTIAICSNEGDIDIAANVPPLYVVSMGMEKVIPSQRELALFVRLLSRSSLGYDITQYTTHIRGPREGQEMHVVILDNGRSDRLKEVYWPVLKCIRCGACMNTCPVFRRTSGLSYDAPYMGPLGVALEPSYDLHRYARLPYSCTHCGSCGDVCPVKVPLPELIFYWRQVVVDRRESLFTHDAEEGVMTEVLKNATNLQLAEKAGLWALRHTPQKIAESRLNPWAEFHRNPEPPKETFRQWYDKNTGPLPTEKHVAAGQEKAGENCTALPTEFPPMPNPYNAKAPKIEDKALPEIPMFSVPGDPLVNFISHLKGFDGEFQLFVTRNEAVEWLRKNVTGPALSGKNSSTEDDGDDNGKKVIFSAIDDVPGNRTLADYKTPAEMHEIDICIGRGILAVGETGSVLVDQKSVGMSCAALFSHDLYLLVDRKTLLSSIQEAYADVDLRDYQYCSFFSGPSATADIEAVHITGAQGEVSLTVVMYGCDPAEIKEVSEMLDRLPQGTPLAQPGAPLPHRIRYTDPSIGQDSV